MNDNVILSRKELRRILAERDDEMSDIFAKMVERSVNRALMSAGVVKSHISKTEAYKRYGRCAVDRWIKEGWLSQQKDGDANCICRISVAELEETASRFNHPSMRTIKQAAALRRDQLNAQ